jgi:hypothetical protein
MKLYLGADDYKIVLPTKIKAELSISIHQGNGQEVPSQGSSSPQPQD